MNPPNNEENSQPPLNSTRTEFARHLGPALVGGLIALGIGLAANNVVLAIYLWCIFQTGITVGAVLHYRWGMRDMETIVDRVYGEDWDRDVVIGKMARRIMEREDAPAQQMVQLLGGKKVKSAFIERRP